MASEYRTGRVRTARAGCTYHPRSTGTTITYHFSDGTTRAQEYHGRCYVNEVEKTSAGELFYQETLQEWCNFDSGGGEIRYYEKVVDTVSNYTPHPQTGRLPCVFTFMATAPKGSPSGTSGGESWSGGDYSQAGATLTFDTYFRPYGIALPVNDPGSACAGFNASATYGRCSATGENENPADMRDIPIFNVARYENGGYFRNLPLGPYLVSPYTWMPSYSVGVTINLHEIDASGNDTRLAVAKNWTLVSPIWSDLPSIHATGLASTEDYLASSSYTWSGQDWAAFSICAGYGSPRQPTLTQGGVVYSNRPPVTNPDPSLSESVNADIWQRVTGSYVATPFWFDSNGNSLNIPINVQGLTSGYQFHIAPNGDVDLQGTFTTTTPGHSNVPGKEVTFAIGQTATINLAVDAAYQHVGYRWLKYVVESDSGCRITINFNFDAKTYYIPAGETRTITLDKANVFVTESPIDHAIGTTHFSALDVGISATGGTHVKLVAVTASHDAPSGVNVSEQFQAYYPTSLRPDDPAYPVRLGGLVLMGSGVPTLILDQTFDIWTVADWTTNNKACGWTGTAIGPTSPATGTKEWAYLTDEGGPIDTTRMKLSFINRSIPFLLGLSTEGLTLECLPRYNAVLFYRYAGDVIHGGDYGQETNVTFDGATCHASFYTMMGGKKPSYNIATESAPGQTDPRTGGNPGAADHEILRSMSDQFFRSEELTAMYGRDRVIWPNILLESHTPADDLRAVSKVPGSPYDRYHLPWQLEFGSPNGYWFLWSGDNPTTSKNRRVDTLSHPHTGIWSMAEALGDGSAIQFRRTNGLLITEASIQDPTLVVVAADGETLSAPSYGIEYGSPGDRLRLLYQSATETGSKVYRTFSSDDGDTWSAPEMAFDGGQMPVVGRGMHAFLGEMLEAAFIPSGLDDGNGTIAARFQSPGDPTPSDEFTIRGWDGTTLAPLQVTDAGFHFIQMQEMQARWCMLAMIPGETEFSRWVSADESSPDGMTFERLPSA